MNQVAKRTENNWFVIGLALLFGLIALSISFSIEIQLQNMLLWVFLEEALKFMAVFSLYLLLKKKVNVFLLGIAVAMSFAFVENLGFFIIFPKANFILFRIPNIFLHILSTSIAVSSIALWERYKIKVTLLIPIIWFAAFFIHLAFNIFVINL